MRLSSDLAAVTQVGPLEPAEAETLGQNGYLLLRGVIPAAWREPLRGAFDAGELANDKWPVARGHDWRHALVDLDPTVQQVCRLPRLLAAMGCLLDGPFFLAQVEGREPRAGGGAQLPHRDGMERAPGDIVSALAFLDPYGPANGATEVTPGTHRGAGLEITGDVRHPDAQVLEGDAGDVLVFDANVLHGATRNESGERRRSLLITFAVRRLWESFEQTRDLRAVRMDTRELFEGPPRPGG